MKLQFRGQVLGAGPSSGTRTSIDWLELSVKHLEPLQLGAILHEHLGPGFGPADFEVERDDEKRFLAMGPNGVRLLADPVGQENRDGVREPWSSVKLPGKSCRATGTEKLLRLLAVLLDDAYGLKVSRLDVAIDDFDRSFIPRQFAEACVDGDLSSEAAVLGRGVITRVRPTNWDWSRRKNGCFWLGGAKAARRLRVYDKEAESRGAIEAVRVELQCRDEYALDMAHRLVAAMVAERPLGDVARERVRGFVDLRVPSGSRSRSQEWPQVDWWAQFIGSGTSDGIPREDPTDARTWKAQCSKQFGLRSAHSWVSFCGFTGSRQRTCGSWRGSEANWGRRSSWPAPSRTSLGE
ncbi:MAG: replication initiation factor domain-containing protein [Planctomycetota bacterium]